MDDEFMDEPWGEFGEEIEEGPWEVEFEEEPSIDDGRHQQEEENEADDEWIEIVETEEGFDTKPRKVPSPHDDLEEPSWEHEEEEDKKRVDDVQKVVDEHLNPVEDVEAQWSQYSTITPDLQAAKKKKKEDDKEDGKKKNVKGKSDPSVAPTVSASLMPASPAPASVATVTVTSLPSPPATSKQQNPPPPAPAAPQPPAPAPAPAQPPAPAPAPAQPNPPFLSQQPAPIPTTLQTAAGSTSTPAVDVVSPPHAGQPGAPIALPIASPVPSSDMSMNTPALGYSQDLGGLGQIGVFSNDSFSHLNHRMDSLTVLLTFLFVIFYSRTSYN